MTTPEKLRVMEDIWDDLRRSPETVPSPAWHADVLETRERRLQDGTAEVIDWQTSKKRIRSRTQ